MALWVDPDRAIVRIGGARAARALNGLLTADVEALEPGTATLSFVLTAKGRPLALPTVVRTQYGFLLDVSRTALPGLLEHFRVYLPPRFAAVEVLEAAARASLIGPDAVEHGAALDGRGDPIRVARNPTDGAGFDLYYTKDALDREWAESVVLETGGAIATATDFETWRIERAIRRFGQDVSAENLPQETNLVERAVSFDKGCYTGQEVVARIHYRGHVHRQLRGLRSLDPDRGGSLEPGSALQFRQRPAGFVTSSCHSPRLGRIALAYVRREAAPGDIVNGPSGEDDRWSVETLPFTSA